MKIKDMKEVIAHKAFEEAVDLDDYDITVFTDCKVTCVDMYIDTTTKELVIEL